jgi:hypothetical protein
MEKVMYCKSAGFKSMPTKFNNIADFLQLLERLCELSKECGLWCTQNRIDHIVFRYIKKESCERGLIVQQDLIRVDFPLDFLKELKGLILNAPTITSTSLELVGLIDYITYGVKDDILYFSTK